MESKNHPNLRLTFYGDDFTGSTDVMESLALLDIPTALFMNVPDAVHVQNYQFRNPKFKSRKIESVGIAGISRSCATPVLEKELPIIFEKIAKLHADYFHYKICSTFDSSPEIGNIGRAIEIACHYFYSEKIPLLVGMPRLNRFVVFGNLFARINGFSYRLDRHPTMSKHPITPMDESDLLKHLANQTNLTSESIDVLSLDGDEKSLYLHYESIQEKIVLFDTITNDHLLIIGKLITLNWKQRNQLLVGSSAVENALFAQDATSKLDFEKAGKASKMLVISGSCSPVTATQIKYAEQKGFHTLAIDAVKLLNENERTMEILRIQNIVSGRLQSNNPVICYSALGFEDPSVNQVKNIEGGQEKLPVVLGELLKGLIEKTKPDRVVAAGGDTSGKITQLLEIESLEFLMPLAPGAPMCIAHSKNSATDNLQIILKGGQNGDETFFEKAYLGI